MDRSTLDKIRIQRILHPEKKGSEKTEKGLFLSHPYASFFSSFPSRRANICAENNPRVCQEECEKTACKVNTEMVDALVSMMRCRK